MTINLIGAKPSALVTIALRMRWRFMARAINTWAVVIATATTNTTVHAVHRSRRIRGHGEGLGIGFKSLIPLLSIVIVYTALVLTESLPIHECLKMISTKSADSFFLFHAHRLAFIRTCVYGSLVPIYTIVYFSLDIVYTFV